MSGGGGGGGGGGSGGSGAGAEAVAVEAEAEAREEVEAEAHRGGTRTDRPRHQRDDRPCLIYPHATSLWVRATKLTEVAPEPIGRERSPEPSR